MARRSGVAFLKWMRGAQVSPDMDIDDIDVAKLRAQIDKLASLGRLPRDVTMTPELAGDVPGEWVVWDGADADRVVLWMHGGAHCLCSPVTHRGLAASVSRAARARVFVPDYPLAPEHPFPAGRDSLLGVWRWLIAEQGFDPAKMAFGGDSSGGGMVFSVATEARERAMPLPGAIVALSPWVDLTLSGESYRTRDSIDPWLDASLAALPVDAYCGGLPHDHPGVSPLFADLTGLPPTLIHVGTDEILFDDGRAMVEALRRDGVRADLGVFKRMWHVFHAIPGIPEGKRALREVGAFVRRHTGGYPHPVATDADSEAGAA